MCTAAHARWAGSVATGLRRALTSSLTSELVDACALVPPVDGGDVVPGTPSTVVRIAQLVPTRFLHLWVRDPAGEELEGLGLPVAPSGALSTFLFESSLAFSSCLISADTVVQV